MDELTRMQTFINVVEAGSFSAAARDVLSVSSVARQVKSLEDDLGVRLLNRSTRSLSLTEPGRRFYERACQIVNDLGVAKSEAKSFQERVKGTLRVSLQISAGATMIVPALRPFLEQYPELTIDISLTDKKLDLIATNTDVAVWLGALPDSDLVARRLSPARRIVCGAPAYLERHGVPQSPADLGRHNCLLFTGRPLRNSWGFTDGGKHHDVEVKGSVRTDSGTVLLDAALAGIGLVVVNEWTGRLLIAQGRLVRVLADYEVTPRPGDADLNVIYSSSRQLSRNVRAFVDFLVDLFRGYQEPMRAN